MDGPSPAAQPHVDASAPAAPPPPYVEAPPAVHTPAEPAPAPPAQSAAIRVLCRIRPSKRPSGFFTPDAAAGVLNFHVPADVERDVCNSAGSAHAYKFATILGAEVAQEEVFDAVARDAVDAALDGFNSTVFAYGQTGSGKTFTVTGGAERYADRGIIPRALQRVFAAAKANAKEQVMVHISYMEIYNEAAYDLLDSSQEMRALEELPCVGWLDARAPARPPRAAYAPPHTRTHPPTHPPTHTRAFTAAVSRCRRTRRARCTCAG